MSASGEAIDGAATAAGDPLVTLVGSAFGMSIFQLAGLPALASCLATGAGSARTIGEMATDSPMALTFAAPAVVARA